MSHGWPARWTGTIAFVRSVTSSATRGPRVSQPERSVSATASTSSSPIAGGWKPRNVARRRSGKDFCIPPRGGRAHGDDEPVRRDGDERDDERVDEEPRAVVLAEVGEHADEERPGEH